MSTWISSPKHTLKKKKPNMVIWAVIPSTGGQRQGDPWSSLTSQPRFISELQDNQRPCLKVNCILIFLIMTPEPDLHTTYYTLTHTHGPTLKPITQICWDLNLNSVRTRNDEHLLTYVLQDGYSPLTLLMFPTQPCQIANNFSETKTLTRSGVDMKIQRAKSSRAFLKKRWKAVIPLLADFKTILNLW